MATLMGQGLSLMPLIRWLGLTPDGEPEQERQQARLAAAQADLTRLQDLAGQEWVSEGTWTHLRSWYNEKQDTPANGVMENNPCTTMRWLPSNGCIMN